MTPREIEVHIDELVLHGIPPGERWTIAEALGSELQALLVERGVPPSWFSNPEQIDAGQVSAHRPAGAPAAGREIGRAVYHGDGQ